MREEVLEALVKAKSLNSPDMSNFVAGEVVRRVEVKF